VLSLALGTTLCFAGLCMSALLGLLAEVAFGACHRAPHDAISDSPAAVASLFLHNAGVAGIALGLAALGWDRTPRLARVGDALLAASLAVNGGVVGYALARSGVELARYLPHLPFEWLGMAAGGGAWLSLRLSQPSDRTAVLLCALALASGALLVAALLEVYAAPLG
jgi:hypothetical protein